MPIRTGVFSIFMEVEEDLKNLFKEVVDTVNENERNEEQNQN